MAKKRKTPPRYKSGPKKGRFMSKRAQAAKKRAKPKSKRKSTALVKRKSTALSGRGKTKSMAKKKRRRRRGRSGGGGLMADKDLMIGGAIYGFVSQPGAEAESFSAQFQEQISKLPSIGNRDVTAGLALYFIERHLWANKYLRNASRAALTVGAVNFGRKGFSLEGEGVGGYGDALDVTDEGEKLSGVMD